jgi:DNA-binding CsgD family transcriptional regulator
MSEDSASALSEREMEILKLVAQGLANKEIARELFISANTVKVHLRNIFGKLEVSSRTEATMVAVRQGWVAVEMEVPESEAIAEAEAEALAVPLARWQRVFLLVALTAVLMLLAWTWPQPAPAEESPENPLIDNPGPMTLVGPPNLTSRWQEEVSMSIGRGRLAAAAVGGRIYAIGGEMPGGGFTGAVEAYEPVQRTWTLKATKPVPVANVSGAVLADKIYVPGGSISEMGVTAVVEVYDPAADQWTQVAPLPEARAAYALAVHGEKVYLFGGFDGQQDVATVFVYDPATDEWQPGPSMPSARAFAGAAALDDEIYVVGGYANEVELDRCEVYLPATGEWQTCAPLLEGRGGLSLIAVGGKLQAIGGGWDGYLAYNQWYDPGRDAWFRFQTPIPGQWRNAAAAEIDGLVYVVGGWRDEFLNVNLAYQAMYKAFIPSVFLPESSTPGSTEP